jgi:hypothetical protein
MAYVTPTVDISRAEESQCFVCAHRIKTPRREKIAPKVSITEAQCEKGIEIIRAYYASLTGRPHFEVKEN